MCPQESDWQVRGGCASALPQPANSSKFVYGMDTFLIHRGYISHTVCISLESDSKGVDPLFMRCCVPVIKSDSSRVSLRGICCILLVEAEMKKLSFSESFVGEWSGT
jgi:hypothetical protein